MDITDINKSKAILEAALNKQEINEANGISLVKQIQSAYIDYVNNYTKVSDYAASNGLTTNQANVIILAGKTLVGVNTPKKKTKSRSNYKKDSDYVGSHYTDIDDIGNPV